MTRLDRFFVFAGISLVVLNLILKLVEYWITATIPDEIEYYEDDPYFTERKAQYEIINKVK
ncbi:hypothetical protein BHU61_06590 [Macrococcus epidermidis]|uniref:Uncharacterized protein n=1 Tax=Macrococcus epidermidis TaxID=1902580 RepID=A0A327ZSF6_9STAP|nr:hypothetical protein [Macrococcus epidermidis]RAK44976.1 hypothetical protein BHU61_06590 [Macrococcus epidermidis]